MTLFVGREVNVEPVSTSVSEHYASASLADADHYRFLVVPAKFKFSALDLVILDELDYQPLSQTGGALLVHLLSKLYERISVLITANLNFGGGSVFVDAMMTTALLTD